LPASLDVEPMRRTPEVGINMGWAETTKLYSSDKMKANGVKIYMFGPYQISKNLYNMALVQIDKLESGSIKYICLDRFHRNKNICNCIHALSDLDSTQATLETGIAHGGGGSDMVVNHFSKHIIKSNENMSWIIDELGIQIEIGNYPKPIINANAGIIRILRIVKR
jgi:sugar phosphate isomerase/epimerase